MLRYFSTKEGGEKKKKKVTKKRKVVDDDDVDVENSTTPDHNANKKIKTITAKKKKRKPAQGHKVATQSQVDKIIKDTKQLQAKNLRFDHTKAFNGDVEPISEPQEMFDDMVRRANESAAIKDKEGVTKFLNHVGDRPIRVATMCSGTESPVLALKMIAKAAKDQGLGDLRIEHVFSAEIEPYKQAYISRNFGDHDLILFRDVEELQFTHAHTAYGARVEVPLDVDLLIAGTSCKDCSSLNNQRQDLLDKNAQGTGGESYRTFFGMFSWVKRARPAFVILENVSGAPWDDMCATFESINYHATWRKVDTKMWYIPHTRERGYLIAINRDHLEKKKGDRTKIWHQLMGGVQGVGLQRCASSTVEEFLLDSDSDKVFPLRTNHELYITARKAGWDRCLARHAKRRFVEGLGDARPITGWNPNGVAKPLCDWWRPWLRSLTDRTLDVVDIQFLSYVKHQRMDFRWKQLVCDLSQNIDRQSRAKFGLTGCLTPGGILLLTNRGGPVIGVETLKLQGLPVDDLLLTRETMAELQDFAGNAMTSTVVGASMLAGLLSSPDALAPRTSSSSSSTLSLSSKMDVDDNLDNTVVVMGNDMLTPYKGSNSTSFTSLQDLLSKAHKSARRCETEGNHRVCDRVHVCKDCEHSVDATMAGKPSHNFEKTELASERLKPRDFVIELQKFLPMRMEIQDLDVNMLNRVAESKGWSIGSDVDYVWSESNEDAKKKKNATTTNTTTKKKVNAFAAMMKAASQRKRMRSTATVSSSHAPPHKKLSRDAKAKMRVMWRRAVCKVNKTQFHFREIRRDRVWKAIYTNTQRDVLELVLDRRAPEWRLTLHAPKVSDEAGFELRRVLRSPVARMQVKSLDKGMTRGVWDILVPKRYTCKLRITPHRPHNGETDKQGHDKDTTESWESTLGIKGDFENSRVWKQIQVDIMGDDDDDDDVSKTFDEDVRGIYTLLHKCDGPMGSLHRREVNPLDVSTSSRPMYFYLDPKKIGPASQDSFVFAHTSPHVRTRGRETRDTIAQLEPCSWFCNSDKKSVEVNCSVRGVWISSSSLLRCVQDLEPCMIPSNEIRPSVNSCCEYNILAKAKIDMKQALSEKVWKSANANRGQWISVPLIRSGSRAAAVELSWITTRLEVPTLLQDWTSLDATKLDVSLNDSHKAVVCEKCAPTPPSLEFFRKKHRLVPRENPEEAGPYERAIKNRPDIFDISLCVESESTGWFRVCANVSSLAHRSVASLPLTRVFQDRKDNDDVKLTVQWRLVRHEPECAPVEPFKLCSNRPDTPEKFGLEVWPQPPSILDTNYRLRPEQLRSLHWMIRQENTKVPYNEQSLSEAILPHLGWRAEVNTSVSVKIRGGVLADKVGYGKTALAVSLHDAQRKNRNIARSAKGAIPVKATLVIVPSQLGKQWYREIFKFTEGKNSAPYGRFKKSTKHVLLIESLVDLNKMSVNDIKEAEFVICVEDVFKKSEVYWTRFAAFVGVAQMPTVGNQEKKKGSRTSRAFEIRYADALRRLRSRVTEMISSSSSSGKELRQNILQDLQKTQDFLVKNAPFVQDKVLHGKELRQKKLLSDAKAIEEKKAREHTERIESATKAVEALKLEIEKDIWDLKKIDNLLNMKSPPLEMFLFHRVVVDEYTYLTGRAKAVVTTGLRAVNRWCLSATPPLSSFEDIKTIASVLHVHLGKSAPNQQNKNRSSAAEMFHSYREMHSPHWHKWRHDVAQQFLNRFVRQNIAEIDEIKAEEHVVVIDPPPAERAIYLELEHYLRAMEMRKGRKSSKIKRQPRTGAGAGSGIQSEIGLERADKESRMWEVLDNAKTGEEALLKRAAHFENLSGHHLTGQFEVRRGESVATWKSEHNDGVKQQHNIEVGDELKIDGKFYVVKQISSDKITFDRTFSKDKKSIGATLMNRNADPLQTCKTIFSSRERQIQETKEEFTMKLKQAHNLRHHIKALKGQNTVATGLAAYRDWSKSLAIRDTDAALILKQVFQDAESSPLKLSLEDTMKMYEIEKDDGPEINSLQWKLRELTNLELRNLTKETVSRVRQLRFFNTVRDLCTNAQTKDCAILSCCGHRGAVELVKKSAMLGQCVEKNCGALVTPDHVILGSRLGGGAVGGGGHSPTGQFGSKLTALVNFMKSKCPVRDPASLTERVLIFVQFEDLMEKVKYVLERANIVVATISGSAKQRSTVLESYQEDYVKGAAQVLLLKLDDASASGCNLTMANHAIFVHPLLSDRGKEWYTACEDQAVGRIRRYGQTRTVNVWRLLVDDTIDCDVIRNNFSTTIGKRFIHTNSSRKTMRVPELGEQWVEAKRFTTYLAGVPGMTARKAESIFSNLRSESSVVTSKDGRKCADVSACVDILRKYANGKLSDEVFGKLWDLVDCAGDNMLDEEALSVALHLIDLVLAGDELPKSLPKDLTPSFFCDKFE